MKGDTFEKEIFQTKRRLGKEDFAYTKSWS